MACTKKQWMEKGKEPKKNSRQKHLKNQSSRKLKSDVTPAEEEPRNLQQCSKPHASLTTAPYLQSMTLNPSWSSTKPRCLSTSNSSPAVLRRAVVCIEDIRHSPDARIAEMVKKQLAKGGNCSKSPSRAANSPDQRSDVPVKKSFQNEEAAMSDKTVSSSSAAVPGSKNIFEQFDIVGGRSPRTRSNSPRSRQVSSSQNDSSGTRSSSEEKQQASVATAVRALKVLSGKVSDAQGKTQPPKDRKSGTRSRHSSPGSASPRAHNSVSPKRQSPRRTSEKMSPPVVVTQKSPKIKSSSTSAAESDSNESPTAGRRVKSPRGMGESTGSSLSSPRSSRSSLNQDRSPHKELEVKGDKSCSKGEKSKGDKALLTGVTREHTIHILSSTSRSSKIIQVDPGPSLVSAARRLFVETEPGNHSPSDRQFKSCGVADSGKGSDIKHNTCDLQFRASSSRGCPEVNRSVTSASEENESLLCAMLVGGSEVTKYYEQSREGNAAHVGKQQPNEGAERLEQKPSPNSSNLNSHDSFFDDDFADDLESRPYELPVLSHLPPLKKPDLAVLDLTLAEPSCSEDLPPPQCQRGHRKKTLPLLELISRVRNNFPSNSEASQDIIHGAEQALFEQSSESESERDMSHTAVDTDSGIVSKDKNVVDSHLSSQTEEASEKAAVASKCEPSHTTLPTKSQGSSVPSSLQPAISESGGIQRVVLDAPGSPSSLGELDTAKITHAATQAVQTHAGGTSGAQQQVEKGSGEIAGKIPVSQLPSQPVKMFQSTSSGVQWQSSSGGSGAPSQAGESSSVPGPSCSRSSSHTPSQFRTFFSRLSSPSKQRWKPKVEPVTNTGHPGWSKWHTVKSPLPIDILSHHEKNSHISKAAAFASKELDSYLRQPVNRFVIPAARDSKLARFMLAEGHIKDFDELQRHLSGEDIVERSFEDEEAGVKSEEEGEEDERDSEMARKLDPDFDEVGGLVFVSFPSEMGLTAHAKVEESLQWQKDSSAYINMAKFHAFEESRRRDGKIRRESQGLRGQHMKWRKYQRLYRQELRRLYEENNKDLPLPLSKLPEKTSDIHKIKNWKKKFGEMKQEDLEALELLGEEDERVKRKRKTYVFSSKKKKVKRLENIVEVVVKKEETSTEAYEDGEALDSSFEQGEEEDNYGVPIPIDQDGYMYDVQSSLEEMRLKEKGLKQSKGIFARYNMGPEDRHIFKKLGGWVTRFRRFRRMPPEMKQGDGQHRSHKKRSPRKERHKPSFELPCLTTGQIMRALSMLQVESCGDGRKASPEGTADNLANSLDEKGGVMDLSFVESTPEDKTKKLDCDKPGCRYGCICHLCLPSAESDETDQPVTSTPVGRACDKEYCRLGCICESLEKAGTTPSPGCSTSSSKATASLAPSNSSLPCNKPECSEKCLCQLTGKNKDNKENKDVHQLPRIKQEPPSMQAVKTETVDHTESSGDELPTLEKTAPRRQRSVDRYSNLPRRQTSYRIAKNLDAVSRKAMMMWETSEVYSEQTSNRRKKVPETAMPSVSVRSPGVPLCLAIMSSSSVLSSTPTTTHSSTVTASVSVNTLPAMMMSPPSMPRTPTTPCMPPPSAPQGTGLMSPGPSSSVGSKLSQELSPILVREEEGKADTQDLSSEPRIMSKRSRTKKRPVGQASDEDMASKRMKQSSASSMSALTPPAVPDAASPSTVTMPQPSQWHSSLICLKASCTNAAKKDNNSNDDVMEEDEIKLFEFIVNCDWERAKKEILMAITSTLKRGVYPEPRTMMIARFKVEILPKAHRPSIIPMELRSKLPKSMYSVRVRVTELPKEPEKTVVGVSTSSFLIPATPIPAFYSGVSSIQGVLPLTGVLAGQGNIRGPAPPGIPSSSVTSAAETVSTGSSNVGISGLTQLQIMQNRGASAELTSGQGQIMQHFKIQKDSVGVSSHAPGEPGEKKKKKKKKKKKSLDPGDDSLVPDLINLTVSPRGSQSNSPTKLGQPTVVTSNPPFRSSSSSTTQLKQPVVSTMGPVMPQPVPMQPGNRMPAVRPPQLLGLPNLPANLTGVKFLQLPGQNNLLQIVPASALGLKAMDNKNIPNFVAVPVSFSSISPGAVSSKKMGSKVQIDVPSKVFTQAQHDIAQHAAGVTQSTGKGSGSGTGAKSETVSRESTPSDAIANGDEKPVKKKKKKKKKKVLEGDNTVGGSTSESVTSATSGPLISSPVLVASSPSPIMSSAKAHSVQMVRNSHAVDNQSSAAASSLSSVSSSSAVVSQAAADSITMTTGETTVMLAKCGHKTGEVPVNSDRHRQNHTDGAAAPEGAAEGEGLPGHSGSAVGTSCFKPEPDDAAAVLSSMTPIHIQLEDVHASIMDEESSWSGFDSVDLSTDSESSDDGRQPLWKSPTVSNDEKKPSSKCDDDIDVGSDPAPPGDVTSKLTSLRTEEGMAVHRDNEKRRRKDLRVGFRELWNVLNVANNLPRSLSQVKILSKTINLIQYHQRLASLLRKNLASQQEQQASLKQQLKHLIDQQLAKGVTKNSIQSILSRAKMVEEPDDHQLMPGSSPSSAVSAEHGCLMQLSEASYPADTSEGHLKSSTPLTRHSVAEVEVEGRKSCFIIEIDRGDEDLVPENGADSETWGQGEGRESGKFKNVSSGPGKISTQKDKSDARAEGTEMSDSVETKNGATADTEQDGADSWLPGSCNSQGSDAGQLVSSSQPGDEVDGAVTTCKREGVSDGECGEGGVGLPDDTNITAGADSEAVQQGSEDLSENHTEEEESEGMGLVIASVTSLHNSGINFEDNDEEIDEKGCDSDVIV